MHSGAQPSCLQVSPTACVSIVLSPGLKNSLEGTNSVGFPQPCWWLLVAVNVSFKKASVTFVQLWNLDELGANPKKKRAVYPCALNGVKHSTDFNRSLLVIACHCS